MQTAVYKVQNKINGKLYFGLSAYPTARWSTHKRRALDGYKSKLCTAMRKYGNDKFSFEIIHVCATRDDANELEHFLIEEVGTRHCGYNIREGGDSGSLAEETKIAIGLRGLGRKVSEETRAKIRAGHLGKIKGPLSDATKKKLSILNKGRAHTAEAVAKIKQASTGRKYPNRKPQSAEARRKAANTTSVTRRKNAKKVQCVETGASYECTRDAARACGVSEALVSMHCNGKMRGGKTKKGLSFRYISMSEEVEKVELNMPQPEFTLNPVSIIADSFEPEFEISEEV